MDTMVRTHVLLPKKLLDEIDALVGPRKRSEYIAEVLEEDVRRKRLLGALAAVAATPPDQRVKGEWNNAESPAAWVHELRHTESNRERWLRENWYERQD